MERNVDSHGNGSITSINRQGIRFYQSVNSLWGAMPLSQIEDPNGNFLTISCYPLTYYFCSEPYTQYMTDTVGRVWTYYAGNSDTSGCPVDAVKADIWDTPGTAGGTRRFKLCYSNVSISTQFNSTGVSECTGTYQLVTALVLPDGTF